MMFQLDLIIQRIVRGLFPFAAQESRAAQECPPAVEGLARVEDLTAPPVVGEWYAVPCMPSGTSGLWIPVTGPAHTDGDIPGGDELHRHIDLRFIGESLLRLSLGPSQAPIALAGSLHMVLRSGLTTVVPADKPPELRALRCLRLQPIHPGDWIRAIVEAALPAGACITEGRCPHRGQLLRSMPVVLEGGEPVTVCPAHGARFDGSGRLRRRCPRKESP